MRKGCQKFLAFFLALIVLISSNGIVVAAHNCFSSHKSKVFLSAPSTCCHKEKQSCHSKPVDQTSFVKKCCEVKITYHKIDVKTPITKNPQVQQPGIHSPVPFSFADFSFGTFSSFKVNKDYLP